MQAFLIRQAYTPKTIDDSLLKLNKLYKITLQNFSEQRFGDIHCVRTHTYTRLYVCIRTHDCTYAYVHDVYHQSVVLTELLAILFHNWHIFILFLKFPLSAVRNGKFQSNCWISGTNQIAGFHVPDRSQNSHIISQILISFHLLSPYFPLSFGGAEKQIG